MSYTLTEVDEYYILFVEEYPTLRYAISSSSIDYDTVCSLVELSIEQIIARHVQQTIEISRNKRKSEFSLFDKYQLTLLWDELNNTQRQEYVAWREEWLNVTETLNEPNRLEWFTE